MATVSSHVLNGSDGTHAGAVAMRLINIDTGDTLFKSSTDDDGRFSQSVDLTNAIAEHRYELVVSTAQYWLSKDVASDQFIDEIVLRFRMPDPDARYHKPLIIAPNSYSTWSSVAE